MKYIYQPLLLLLLCTNLTAQPWQQLPDVPLDLAFPIVVALRGNIHVLGGGASGTASDLHLRYSPVTNTWDTLPPVPYLAQQAAGTVLSDRIHICGGGYPTSGQRLDVHYYYDPDSVQWYPAANMPVAVAIHKAVTFDNKMWVLSGQPDKYLCEYYDPVNDNWVQKNSLPDQNFWYGAIVGTNTSIYRFGGGAYFSPTSAAHVYNPANDTWIPLPPLPNGGLHAPAATVIDNDHIFIAGGYTGTTTVGQSWVYWVSGQTYLPSDSLPTANNYHSIVTIDTCVYSVGGYLLNTPQVSTGLYKNCLPLFPVGIEYPENHSDKPYTAIITPTQFSLDFSAASSYAQVALKIYDLTGKLVLDVNQTLSDTPIALDGQSFVPGRYVILVFVNGKMYRESWLVNPTH